MRLFYNIRKILCTGMISSLTFMVFIYDIMTVIEQTGSDQSVKL